MATLVAGCSSMSSMSVASLPFRSPRLAGSRHSAQSQMLEGVLDRPRAFYKDRPRRGSSWQQQQATLSLRQRRNIPGRSSSRNAVHWRVQANSINDRPSYDDASIKSTGIASGSSDSPGSRITSINGSETKNVPENVHGVPMIRNASGSQVLSAVTASVSSAAVGCLTSLLLATTAISAVSPGDVPPALAEEPVVAESAFGGAFNSGFESLLPFLTSGGLDEALYDAEADNVADGEQLSALGSVGEYARVAEGQFAPVGTASVAEEYIRPGNRPDLPMSNPLFGPKRQADEPQQVHISLAAPGAMRVTWVTMDGAAPAVVQYGDAPGRFTHTVTGTTTKYSFLFYRSGFIHSAVIGGPDNPLLPNTTYYYRIGNSANAADEAAGEATGAAVVVVSREAGAAGVATAASMGSSSSSVVALQAGGVSSGRGIAASGFSERAFKTPPADPTDSINIAIVGDMGQTGWTVSTLDHIAQQPHDLLVLPGDLSYADAYQPRWDTWHNLIEPLASARPWMVVPGNHEIEGLPGLVRPFVAYNARWKMPAGESGSPSNLFYSFESAGVHWVMLNSYSDFEPESAQGLWLKSDLAGVDRARTPWLVVVVHAPWYNSNSAHQSEAEPMRRALEQQLYDARVDLVFAGHVHAYERTARVYDGQTDPCGPIHITIGDGGNREGLATRYLYPSPDWSVFREASFGHGELKIFGSKQGKTLAGRSQGSLAGDEEGAYGEAEWVWHRNDDDEAMARDSVRIISLASHKSPAQCRPLSAAPTGF